MIFHRKRRNKEKLIKISKVLAENMIPLLALVAVSAVNGS